MEFNEWLQTELNKRGWDHAELVRRTGLSSGGISHVMNGDRKAGPDFCIAVARAFGISREEVFRARGWLLREPEQIISPLAPPRVVDHMERLINYPPEIRDLVLDAYEAVEGVVVRSSGLKDGSNDEGQKNFSTNFASKLSRLGPKSDKTVDLTVFPEKDRMLIGQLDLAFQEYLAALLKQDEGRYRATMNDAKSRVDAEIRRLQQTLNRP